MQTAVQTLRTHITPTFLADLAGMFGLAVIVYSCLNLPAFL